MRSRATVRALRQRDPADRREARDTVLADLVTRCADRNPTALARFHQLTSPWISHLIRQRTTSVEDADDALVAVYATVWRRAPSFAGVNRTALAWATSITFEVVNASTPVNG